MTAEAPGIARAPVASGTSLDDLGLSARVVHVLSNAGVETAQDVLDRLAEGEADFLDIPGVGDKTLGKVRKRLAEKGLLEPEDAGSGVEQEHQAQAEAERSPTGARKAMGTEPTDSGNTERPPTPSGTGGEAQQQRVSFVVRVTVDERGQPRRTEIEHAQSGNRDAFPALDVQRLAAFIEACIQPPVTPEPTVPPTPPPARAETPAPKRLGPASGSIISGVRVFRAGTPGAAVFVLSSDEAFVLQASFHLGAEVIPLAAQKPPFEMRVYAYEMTSGKPTLLNTHQGTLVEDALDYAPEAQVPGLPPGLYRLITLVTLQAPVTMIGCHEGPIVQVIGSSPSANPVAPLETPLPG
jgi:hypothetical protein